MMKIDKQTQKNCISMIKEVAKKNGYKKTQNTIYKIENENIIFTDFLIVNSEQLVYRINIKKKSFDEIFWKIMRMEDNIAKGDVLRINGAFAAPSVLIADGKIDICENVDIVANDFVELVNIEIESFLKRTNVSDYIFSTNVESDDTILQCISYIDLGFLSKAKELAEKRILLGDTGNFVNEGKGFYELLMVYDG